MADPTIHRAFEAIYKNDAWGLGSGPGSRPSNTIEYRAFVEHFIEANGVRSVTDLGCGDWQFSALMDWSCVIYTGFDVVESLIMTNRARHARPNIAFKLFQTIEDLPGGDLLLSKEFLQHLPSQTIADYINTIRMRYRFALLTNSTEPTGDGERRYRVRWLSTSASQRASVQRSRREGFNLPPADRTFHLQERRVSRDGRRNFVDILDTAPMTPTGQTVCLCMIVEDEAAVIRRCLASVRPIIDHWLIVDTGSTDGTQDFVREALADIPGTLFDRPRLDFAKIRSEALALSKPHGTYSLIIDANDELEIPPNFSMPDLDADAYAVEIRDGDVNCRRNQLVSNALTWRYEGLLQECLRCEDAHVFGYLPLVIRHDIARKRTPEAYRERGGGPQYRARNGSGCRALGPLYARSCSKLP